MRRFADAIRQFWRALWITDEGLMVEALILEMEAERTGAEDIRREAERIRWHVGLEASWREDKAR